MIAFFPHCGFLSETSRMLAMHDALHALGEPVCMASHGGPFESVLDRAGVAWFRLEPRMDAERCARFVRCLPGIGPPDQSFYADDEMLAHVRAEAAFMREHGVRLAVTGFTLTTLLSTRLAGIPLAASHAGSWVPPVLEAGLAPAPSQSRLPLAPLWPQALQRWALARATRGTMYCAGFNRVARTLGVERVPSFGALLLADLTMVTDLPEILGLARDRLESWRPGPAYRPSTTLRYTGPLFARLDLPLPDRVEAFLAAPGPVVYVALTSAPSGWVREVVAGACASGARVLVAATVHDLGDLDGGPVMVEPLLPSHRVMRRCAAAVITGGQGSVQTAMDAGLPFVGVPLQPEQDLNVEIACRHGMAIRLAPKWARGDALAPALRRLLERPGYRESAARVQAIVTPVDGAAGAAAAIRSYLQARPAAPALSAALCTAP